MTVALSRTTQVDDCARLYGAADVPKHHGTKVVLLSAKRMGEVERVACDGEVVWPPEEAGIEGENSRLEQMVGELN